MPTLQVWGVLVGNGKSIPVLLNITFKERTPDGSVTPEIRIVTAMELAQPPVPVPVDGDYIVQFPFHGQKREEPVRFESGKMFGR